MVGTCKSKCVLELGYESNSTVNVMDLHKLSHKDSLGEKAQHRGNSFLQDSVENEVPTYV